MSETDLIDRIREAAFPGILTEGLSLGIIILDTEGRILLWNRWMENHTGTKAAYVLGTPLTALYPEIEDRGKDRYIRDCIAHGKPFLLSPAFHRYLVPIDLQREKENIRMIQNVRIYPAVEGETTIGAILIIEDLTEQILYEGEIVRLNRVLKGIRDVDKLITRVETPEALIQGAREILSTEVGYVGTRIGRIIEGVLRFGTDSPDAPEPAVPPHVRRAVETGRSLEASEVSNKETSEVFNKETSEVSKTSDVSSFGAGLACPLKDWEGRPIGVLVVETDEKAGFGDDERLLLEEVANDIAFALCSLEERRARRRAEREKELLAAQVRQSQKMQSIGTLAGGIAHDFNNILFPIVGYAEMAMDAVSGDSRTVRYLNEIVNAALRARDLVQQILTVGRRGRPVQTPLRLQPVIQEALRFFRATVPETVTFDVAVDDALPPVRGDTSQVHQIVVNLCSNAHHAMAPDGGRLTVRLDEVAAPQIQGLRPGRYARLTVADTGHGIDPEIQERIFDPYFTTKGPGKGSGLGLSVVHGIIKDYGGEVQVESTPGEGARFQVFFPLIDGGPAQRTTTCNPPPSGGVF